MKVIKHGKYFSSGYEDIDHTDLYGKCENCGCEFKTYYNIERDNPKKGDINIIPDADCMAMVVEPDFVYGGSSKKSNGLCSMFLFMS